MPTFFRMRKTCDLDTPNSFATSLADWSALYRAMISATNGNFPVGFGVLLMCCAKAPRMPTHFMAADWLRVYKGMRPTERMTAVELTAYI